MLMKEIFSKQKNFIQLNVRMGMNAAFTDTHKNVKRLLFADDIVYSTLTDYYVIKPFNINHIS